MFFLAPGCSYIGFLPRACCIVHASHMPHTCLARCPLLFSAYSPNVPLLDPPLCLALPTHSSVRPCSTPKVVMSVGGWNFPSSYFSKMVSSATSRGKFVASVKAWMAKYVTHCCTRSRKQRGCHMGLPRALHLSARTINTLLLTLFYSPHIMNVYCVSLPPTGMALTASTSTGSTLAPRSAKTR